MNEGGQVKDPNDCFSLLRAMLIANRNGDSHKVVKLANCMADLQLPIRLASPLNEEVILKKMEIHQERSGQILLRIMQVCKG